MNKRKWEEIQKLQKGKHFMSILHKPLEDLIVYLLYDFKFISADHVSILTYLLAFLVAWFFIKGSVLNALILALVVGVLDGVDGKIARLRKKKTYIGKLEHSFDMLYEQVWYASFIFYLWNKVSSINLVFLGMVWIILDGWVRHIYNTFWIATGKSLKYSGKLASKVTFLDGRRSVYVLHMLLWFFLGKVEFAIYTILIHCSLTALAYLIISLKCLHKKF